ncbi:hypothetical protein D9M68_641580 [compost metagenome]
MHFQAGAGDGRRLRWHGHPQQLGGPGQAGALQHQGNQHDEEGQVEEQLGVGQPGHQREHRENDRDRPAQADPGDKGLFPAMEGAERRQAHQHRERAGEDDHPQRQAQGRNGDGQQVMGRDQQAEHQEHADLRQPGHAVEHVQDAVARTDRPVAQHQAAQVDGEDAAAVQGVGQGEDQQAAADHQQGIEAVGQVDPVDHLQQQPAAGEAEHGADAEFPEEVGEETEADLGLPLGQHVDQGDGEEHRHRVVAAGFDFQGGGDPFVEPLAAEQ